MSEMSVRNRLALLLAFLMLSSVISLLPLSLENGDHPWGNSQTNQFANGNTSVTLAPALNETTSIGYEDGTRITEAEFDFSGAPLQEWQNDSLSAGSSAFSNGAFQQTMLGSSGIELTTTSAPSNGSIPGVGTQNMTVLGLATWNGTHAFDVLRIQCGIVAPCGTIIADGPLTIIANEIVITSGGAIYADSNTWGGSGRGNNGSYGYTTPTGPQTANSGGGGAGHGGDGGDGGNGNGTANQGAGGTAYGNGSEAGSSGGNISNFGSGTRAVGGRGGGQLTLIARNITITGILSADGEDGETGASLGNGSGPGNHGAGGGSGGAILLQAQQLSITQYGEVTALGGDGGDGNAAQAGSTVGGWGQNNAGGHGGGSGGGGRISIITLANGYSNLGTVSMAPGVGGGGGAGSGTGSAGTAGSNGTVGVLTTNTFSGWGSTSGAPWPSSGTLNVLGTLNMQGNHSYNTVHISGTLNSNGPVLQITANTIIIEANASIRSDGIMWGGLGHGASGSHGGNSGTGANGGAHLGAGGVGGGNSNSTNMSYGNGTEPGSSGGNVTQTSSSGAVTVRSTGGRGGGVIILIANNIYINGTVSANGEDGANGPAPTNGGRGIAGAGGGSGGSVLIIANNVWWGQFGYVMAKGGDGGDGSNGMRQTPISLLLYDGGDGGGGGGGGAVNINTTTTGIHGNGRISVFGGSGGTGGRPYGSGQTGRVGASGAAGWSQVSTNFAGWAGSVRVSSGTWTSTVLGVGEIVEGLSIRVSFVILGGTAVNGEFRTTVDNVTWSEWRQLNLTRQSADRLLYFQLRLNLSTSSNHSTPAITGISYEAWWWAALEGDRPLSFSISSSTLATPDWRAGDANGQDPIGNGVRLFHSSEMLSTTGAPPPSGSPYNGTLEVPVPLASAPQDGWVHLSALGLGQSNIVTLSVGRSQLASVDNDDIAFDIALDAQSLAAAWPTSGSSDASGIEWGWLVLNWTSEAPSPQFNHLSLPWNLTQRVGGGGEFVTGIEAMVQAECTEWYLVQGCRQDFPLMATGTSSVLDFPVFISNLFVNATDDISPRLYEAKMEVDGVETTVARHGDMLTFLVTDQIGEQNLTILCKLVQSGQNSTSDPGRTMQWTGQRQAYLLSYDTELYATPGTETQLDFSCDMQDAAGNFANPSVSLQVSILPGPPVVSDLLLSSVSGPFEGGMLTGTWRHDEPITFTVEEMTDRADLDASVELIRRDGGSVISIPLAWDNSTLNYTGVWSLVRYDFGVWDLEVKLLDAQFSDMDDDGARPSTDATLTIVDRLAPNLVAVSFDWSPSDPDVWRTTIEWSAETDESVDVSVDISTETGVHVDRLLVYSTSDNTGHADWYTTDVEPGLYHLEVSMMDSAGNPAPDWRSGPDGEVTIVPPRLLTLEVLEPANGTEIVLGDTVTYRLAISCNDGCAMSLEEEGLVDMSNGTIEFNRTMTSLGDITFFFTLSSGDLSTTGISHLTVVAPPDPLFSLPSCVDGSVDDPEMSLTGHREFVCNVNNMGERPSTVRFRVTNSHPKFTCMPTTAQTILPADSLVVTCRTQGEVEQATDVSTTALFEWQDHGDIWHRIGSEQPFSAYLRPSSDGAQGALDSSEEAGLSPLVIVAALAGLFGIFLTTIFLVRRQRRDEEDQHGASSVGVSDLGGQPQVSEVTELESAVEENDPNLAASYKELPPGGRYEEVPEGMWYVDADDNWWWSEPGGSWRKP